MKPKPMKPVKAWAIINPNYRYPRVFPGEPKSWVEQRANALAGERIALVEIREVAI